MKVFIAEVHLSITAFNLHCWCSFPIPTFLSLLPEQSPSKWYWKLVPVSELLLHQLSSTKPWLFKLLRVFASIAMLLSCSLKNTCVSFWVIRLCFHGVLLAYCTASSILPLQHLWLLPHCRSEGGGVAIKQTGKLPVEMVASAGFGCE